MSNAQETQWIIDQAIEDVAAACRALDGKPYEHKTIDYTRRWEQTDWLQYLYSLALIASQAITKSEPCELILDTIGPNHNTDDFDPTFAALQMISAASREDAATVFALVPQDQERAQMTGARLIALTAEICFGNTKGQTR